VYGVEAADPVAPSIILPGRYPLNIVMFKNLNATKRTAKIIEKFSTKLT